MKLKAIRLATLEDAEAIHALHTASVRALCRNVYSPEIIAGWLRDRTPSGYRGIEKGEMSVAERHGSVVGFSHVVPGEIVAIFVHPDHVRQGIGAALVRHAMTKARATPNGSVRVDSTLNAQPFYETMGFSKTGERVVRRNDVDIPIVEMELDKTCMKVLPQKLWVDEITGGRYSGLLALLVVCLMLAGCNQDESATPPEIDAGDAAKALDSGDYSAAKAMALTALKKKPEVAEYAVAVAFAAVKLKEPAVAREYFNKAHDILEREAKNDPESVDDCTMVLLCLGRKAEARATLDAGVARFPESSHLATLRANLDTWSEELSEYSVAHAERGTEGDASDRAP